MTSVIPEMNRCLNRSSRCYVVTLPKYIGSYSRYVSYLTYSRPLTSLVTC